MKQSKKTTITGHAVEQRPDTSRRKFVKQAAYVAPAILSLQATSALAKSGSGKTKPDTTKPKPKKKST